MHTTEDSYSFSSFDRPIKPDSESIAHEWITIVKREIELILCAMIAEGFAHIVSDSIIAVF